MAVFAQLAAGLARRRLGVSWSAGSWLTGRLVRRCPTRPGPTGSCTGNRWRCAPTPEALMNRYVGTLVIIIIMEGPE